MAASSALCCVVGGKVYEDYAKALHLSAIEFFMPCDENIFITIPGEHGWPNGTMYRWHRLLENMPDTDYVFLCDADMRFEGPVGSEILSESVTLTQHPGYVGAMTHELPFEDRMESSCYVPHGDRIIYFCGGFAGGKTKEVKRFANEIVSRIDSDSASGIIPIWHDESALNKVASLWPDIHILDPGYCYPDNDIYYRTCVWRTMYKRRIVAVDKTQNERGNR